MASSLEEHNHLGSSAQIEARKISNSLKMKAKQSEENPARIVRNTLATVLREIEPYLGSKCSMKQKVIISQEVFRNGKLPGFFDNSP